MQYPSFLQALSGGQTLLSTFKTAYEFCTSWQKGEVSNQTKMALLYLECQRNRSLLEVISWDIAKRRSDTLIQIALALETEVLGLIFLDSIKGNDDLLSTINEITVVDDCADKDNQSTPKKKAINALCFLYQKVSLVKNLTQLNLESEELQKVNLKQRLGNIRTNYAALAAGLRKSNYLKEVEWLSDLHKA